MGINGRVELVQDRAGLVDAPPQFAAELPGLAVHRMERFAKRVEESVRLQADLELGQVEILRIAQCPQQGLIQDLRNALVRRAHAPIHGDIEDIEDNGVGWDLRVDDVEVSRQRVRLGPRQLPLGLFLENLTGRLSANSAVSDRVPYDLGEGGFPGAEKARYPHSDALVGLGGGIGNGLVHGLEMIADGLGDHVLLQFIQYRCLVILVYLDDFLDPSVNRPGE